MKYVVGFIAGIGFLLIVAIILAGTATAMIQRAAEIEEEEEEWDEDLD